MYHAHIAEQLKRLPAKQGDHDRDAELTTEQHIYSKGDLEEYPQVQISAALGEHLFNRFALSKRKVAYVIYLQSLINVKKDTIDKRIVEKLRDNTRVRLSGVPGVAATVFHPKYGTLYPSDQLCGIGEMALVLRQPRVSFRLGKGEVWTYWVILP